MICSSDPVGFTANILFLFLFKQTSELNTATKQLQHVSVWFLMTAGFFAFKSKSQLMADSKSKVCITWMDQSWCRIPAWTWFPVNPCDVVAALSLQWPQSNCRCLSSWRRWAAASRADQTGEAEARCWFLPLSGSGTCRCAASAWVMAGLWKPSAAKTLMCFRWRVCGWIYVLVLVLKMYVNPQVTGLSNKDSDGVPAFPWRWGRRRLDVS